MKIERSVIIGVFGMCLLKIKRVNKFCWKFRLKFSSFGFNFFIWWFDDRIFGIFNVLRKIICFFLFIGFCGMFLIECSDIFFFLCGFNNLII